MFFVWLNVQRSDLPSLLASSVSTQPRSTPRRGLASCWTHSEASLVLHLRVSHFLFLNYVEQMSDECIACRRILWFFWHFCFSSTSLVKNFLLFLSEMQKKMALKKIQPLPPCGEGVFDT